MSVESYEADLSLLLSLGKGLENTVARVDQFGVIVVDNLVNLPDIEMIGLQTVQRRIQHAHGGVLTGAMGADGAHDDDFFSFAFEGEAKLLFTETTVKHPGIVEDIDAVVDGFGNHIVHLSLIRDGAEMEAAHTQDGTFEAGPTQRALLRLEATEGRFVAGFDCRESLLRRNHGGNSCYRSAFQEPPAAYFSSDFECCHS